MLRKHSLVIILLVIALLLTLFASWVAADHVRGHPPPIVILEVPGVPINGVDCAKMNQPYTQEGYTLVPYIQCMHLSSPLTYNGAVYPAGGYINVWIRQ